MKKKSTSIQINHIPTIHYESESVDIKRYCCEFMLKHDFHINTVAKNIFVLEMALESYSKQKLFDWKKRQKETINLEEIESFMTLEGIMEILNSNIPTDSGKDDFFMQYVHCIVYMLGQINQTNNITDEEIMILKPIVTIEKNEITVTSITANPDIPIHEVPEKLIKEIKNIYCPKEKNPILTK